MSLPDTRKRKTLLTDPEGMRADEQRAAQDRALRLLYPSMFSDDPIKDLTSASSVSPPSLAAEDETLYKLYPTMRPSVPVQSHSTTPPHNQVAFAPLIALGAEEAVIYGPLLLMAAKPALDKAAKASKPALDKAVAATRSGWNKAENTAEKAWEDASTWATEWADEAEASTEETLDHVASWAKAHFGGDTNRVVDNAAAWVKEQYGDEAEALQHHALVWARTQFGDDAGQALEEVSGWLEKQFGDGTGQGSALPSATLDPRQADALLPKTEQFPVPQRYPGVPPFPADERHRPILPPSSAPDHENGDGVLSDPMDHRWSEGSSFDYEKLSKPLNHDLGDPTPPDAQKALETIGDPKIRQIVASEFFGRGESTYSDQDGTQVEVQGTYQDAENTLEALEEKLGGRVIPAPMSPKYGNQMGTRLELKNGVQIIARPDSAERVPTLEVQIPRAGKDQKKAYFIKRRYNP